jgi:serine/threonine kinase 32
MGHAHLTDFNVAIHYSERRLHTSIAGSMAYMAPEVVGRKGYTWCCDFWSLGVTAFELLFHKRPFDGRTAERMTQSILKDPIAFPNDTNLKCSPAGVQALRSVSAHLAWFQRTLKFLYFIKQLLDRNPRHRLGCRSNGRGILDIQHHPWFSSIDWDTLNAKEAQPPFVPDVGFTR